VCITRRGKPVAQITALQTPRKRIDLSALRALTDMMPVQRESASNIVHRLRDQDRY
jgi:antitoxin (DNA-binding transcriptional repressor) of toxin-antitoxin stability system